MSSSTNAIQFMIDSLEELDKEFKKENQDYIFLWVKI